MNKIELLSPAGSKEAFLAAIAAGADAIYFGTNQFNARERAENIKLEDLPELISIAKNLLEKGVNQPAQISNRRQP